MKNLTFAVLFTMASGVAVFGGTTDQLELISGSNTAIVNDNGQNPQYGTIVYGNSNFNGWDVNVVSGASHSPGLSPFGLDMTSLTATCEPSGASKSKSSPNCTTQPLEILYTDIGFTETLNANQFMTTYATTQTGGGSTSQSAYFSNLNTAFGKQHLIGTIGPFTTSSVASLVGGGVKPVGPYSLTIEQDFVDSTGSTVSFSADGNVTAVPEPAAILLFGTVLALCATGLRRRRNSVKAGV